FPVPTGPEASPERISEFRELLRVSIRCGFLRASEIFEILLKQIIDRLCGTSPAATSAGSKRELEEFDKLTVAIHQGFGLASWLLDDDATDEYLRRSAAALERARKMFSQSHRVRRACKYGGPGRREPFVGQAGLPVVGDRPGAAGGLFCQRDWVLDTAQSNNVGGVVGGSLR